VAGWLVVLLVACGMVFSAPAKAAAVRLPHRPTVVAISGFRPLSSGYSFANYGNGLGLPNLGSDEMRQLFGDGVCAGFSGGVCVLSPPALAWMQQENAAMADGHCVGLSVTALFFYANLSVPQPFGAAAVPGLKIARNQLLARAIAYGYAFQGLDSVRSAEVSGSPREVLSRLASALRTGSELYTLAITHAGGSGGHAVTPFEIERVGPSRYAILVYDNNDPRVPRTVLVNTSSDTWSYDATTLPNQPGSLYTGSAATRSLFLLPTRPGLGVQPCPFCSATSPTPTTPIEGPVAPSATRYDAVRLQTADGADGHLLITDRRGRQIGFVHGHLVDQIPGARIVRLLVGGTRTWLDQTEPEYQLPTGQRYRITLTGATGAQGRRARAAAASAGSAHASVTVLEPGFLAAVRGINAQPGATDQVGLSARGHAISFVSHGKVDQTPELVVGNATPGTNDHQWNIFSRGTPPRRRVSASLDVAGNRMSFAGTGRYDLAMDKVGNGVSVFAHRDLGLGAGITATLDYAQWSAGDAMPLTETKGGVVVSRGLLRDERDRSDTGSEFEPIESTPAPAEPQPHPVAPGATATALTCSPATVAVGSATNCTVQVSGLDSSAPRTPSGQVTFSSQQSGAFSEDGCTLSAGSCQVTYTPTAVESGTHELTASYLGDSTDHASDDTIAVGVTGGVGVAPGSGTATSVACQPQAVALDAPTTCTATVTNTGAGTQSTPTGAVAFSTNASGGFSPQSCSLAHGTCAVTFTPTAIGSGTQELMASYTGDPTHQPSDGPTAVHVVPRSTSTSVACQPQQVAVGARTTCTVTVADISAGAESIPTGEVSFASNQSGSFSGGCTLSGGSCAVTYSPTAVASGTHELTASYAGDSTHQPSDATTAVQVAPIYTVTSVACQPQQLAVGQQTTCTVTVTDTGTIQTYPTGGVSFFSDGSLEGFTPPFCNLSGGSCTVTYTPTAAGSHEITAKYAGDPTHPPSDGTTTIQVHCRPTGQVADTVGLARGLEGTQHRRQARHHRRRARSRIASATR
jgi:hypothetical protein